MSTKNSANGLVTPTRAASTSAMPQRAADAPRPADHILAQIPDLQPAAGAAPKTWRSTGRIISQSLSVKFVFGVGAALVVGAILPFVFNKAGRPRPVQELPNWNAHDPQAATSTAQTVAPAWSPVSAKQTTVVVPPQPASNFTPPPPAVGDYRPAAMRGPSWSRPQAVAETKPQPQGYPSQFAPRGNPLPGRSENPAVLQADRRNDQAARYNDDPRYGPSYGNDRPLDAPPTGPTAPADATPRDYRYDNPSYDNRSPQPQGSPLMPANNQGASNYRDPSGYDPGVAHFDGSISSPPPRTNP